MLEKGTIQAALTGLLVVLTFCLYSPPQVLAEDMYPRCGGQPCESVAQPAEWPAATSGSSLPVKIWPTVLLDLPAKPKQVNYGGNALTFLYSNDRVYFLQTAPLAEYRDIADKGDRVYMAKQDCITVFYYDNGENPEGVKNNKAFVFNSRSRTPDMMLEIDSRRVELTDFLKVIGSVRQAHQ